MLYGRNRQDLYCVFRSRVTHIIMKKNVQIPKVDFKDDFYQNYR